MENRVKATHWYKEALKADPYCYEAFEHLVDRHLLTLGEEVELLGSLQFDAQDQWLQLLYSSKAKKYGQEKVVEKNLSLLEGTIPPEGGPQLWPEDVATLDGNSDVAACRADLQYQSGQFEACYETTCGVLARDPYHDATMPLHVAAALELGRKNELFLRAHRLVQDYPKRAIAWYAVGCYYLCIHQYDSARRYFCKATQLGEMSLEAWLGFGHAYAAQDESDQAMAAYRTAARLFPGCHMPYLCMGMEYQRSGSLNLAEQFLQDARRMCSRDPLVHNELGVLAFRSQDYGVATQHFQQALALASMPCSQTREVALVNLAHTHRKCRRFHEAAALYERALGLNPRQASTHSALGFTFHLQGNTNLAIEYYHKALDMNPQDLVTSEMLAEALQDDVFVTDSAEALLWNQE